MPAKHPAAEANTEYTLKTQENVWSSLATVRVMSPGIIHNILLSAEQGGYLGDLYKVYETMRVKDARFGGLVSQFGSAIAGVPLKVDPAKGINESERALADELADVAREVLTHLDTREQTKLYVDAHVDGVKAFKRKWALNDYNYGRAMWMPEKIEPIDGAFLLMNRRTDRHEMGELMVMTESQPEGRPFSEIPSHEAFVLEAEYGKNRYDKIGVARRVLPWFITIQIVLSWWIQYAEVYGTPFRIGRYPKNNNSVKLAMEAGMRSLGRSGWAILPEGAQYQLIEANRQGSTTTFSGIVDMGHQEYAIALLGQADTTGDSQAGGYSRFSVSNTIRYEVVRDVANLVSKGYQYTVDDTILVNYGPSVPKRLYPKVRPVVITPDDLGKKTTAATQLANAGAPVPMSYIYEQVLGVDEPREGQWVVWRGVVVKYDPAKMGVPPMGANANTPESAQGNPQQEASEAAARDADADRDPRSKPPGEAGEG